MRPNYLSMWSVLLITVLFTLNVHSDDDYNYAGNKAASQFEPKSGNPACFATDGDLATFSSTTKGQNFWWLVNLGKRILFRSVKVFAKSGTDCETVIIDPEDLNDFCIDSTKYVCTSRLRRVFFLTNPTDDENNPNKDNINSWNICSYSYTSLGEEYTKSCDRGLANPLTRRFSILSSADTIIELKEVEVYGYELPQLSTDIDVRADQVTTNSITISFLQWTQNMIGGLPPTEYVVEASGSGDTRTVSHNKDLQTLRVQFTALDPGTSYTFSVSCRIQGVACPGNAFTVSLSTICTAPEKPGTITLSSVAGQDSGRERWKYTASWQAPDRANCEGELEYSYRVNNGIASTKQKEKTAVFYVDGDEEFQFSVKAVNSKGGSSNKSTSERSGVLKPQYEGNQPTLTATSPYRVSLSIPDPEYPGGAITHHKYQCEGGGWTKLLGNITRCGYQPFTSTMCRAKAKNAAGWGFSEKKITTTLCADPYPPRFLLLSKATSEGTTTIDIYLQESQPRCQSLTSYHITIIDSTGILFYSDTITTASNITVPDALPITNYSVIIEATNNADLKSSTVGYLMTVEAKPPEEPAVVLVTNTSCLTAELKEPEVTNGVILNYLVSCSYLDVSEQRKTLDADTDVTGNVVFCGIPSATLVECNTSASNSVGHGKVSQYEVYTQLLVVNSVKSSIEEVNGAKTGTSLTIKIKNVELQKGDIWSYLVMIDKRFKGAKQKQVESCGCTKESANNVYIDSRECYCYTTAELSAEQVGEEYEFTIGDEKRYGEFYNAELDIEREYLVYIAVKARGIPLVALHPDYLKLSTKYTQHPDYPKLSTSTIKASAPKEGFSVGVVAGSPVGAAVFAALIVLFVILCHRYRNQRMSGHGENTKPAMKTQSLSNFRKNSQGVTEEPTVYKSADVDPAYERMNGVSADHVYCVAQDSLSFNGKPPSSTSQDTNGEPAYEMVKKNSAGHVYSVV